MKPALTNRDTQTTEPTPSTNSDKHAVVLLIEDSFDDRQFVVRSSKKVGYEMTLNVCCDGEDALNYVNREGEYAEPGCAEVPDFVLLDLNLPRLSGLQVLEAIRTHYLYRSIPVVVFSSSSSEDDVCHAWRLGCSSFFEKPSTPTGYIELLNSLCAYWKSGFHLLPAQRRGFSS